MREDAVFFAVPPLDALFFAVVFFAADRPPLAPLPPRPPLPEDFFAVDVDFFVPVDLGAGFFAAEPPERVTVLPVGVRRVVFFAVFAVFAALPDVFAEDFPDAPTRSS